MRREEFDKSQFLGLSNEEFIRLQESFKDRRWLGNYLLLKQFVERFNRFPMQKEQYPKGIRIGGWSHKQKHLYRVGSLPLWKIKLLANLEFDWGKRRESWVEMFQKAKSFQEKKGAPLSRYSTNNDEERSVKMWLYKQNDDIKKGILSKKRTKLLHESGLITNWYDYHFDEFYNKCKRFIKKYKRLPSAHSHDEAECTLGKWRLFQVSRMHEGKLSSDRIDKMNALGLTDKINDVEWKNKYQKVSNIVRQKVETGTVFGEEGIVNTLGKELYTWWRGQKQKYKKGTILTQEQRTLIENALLNCTLEELSCYSVNSNVIKL